MNSSSTKNSSLKIFISHITEDKTKVRNIVKQLRFEECLSLWMAGSDLLPGGEWKVEIEKSIWTADAVIVCFSKKSKEKESYYQSELKTILKAAEEKPIDAYYVIPIRLDDCDIPRGFERWHYVDYKKGWAEGVLRSLEKRAGIIGMNLFFSTTSEKVLIVLDVNFRDFDKKRKKRFISSLALKLEVQESEIKILRTFEGSVKVIAIMTKEAVGRLFDLDSNKDPELYNTLRIKRFEKYFEETLPNLKEGEYSPKIISKGIKQFVTTFVGREPEIDKFEQLLFNPYGKVRILFVLGSGGIGKTRIVNRLLREAGDLEVIAPESPIDLFDTALRSIDGIQWKIIEIVESLTGWRDERSPFVDFRKAHRDTSEQFNQCLRKFCAKTQLVLAFDTFEVLDTVASNWLFSDGNEGLQVPGLICIVAGRPEKEGLDRYLNNPLTSIIKMSGLTFLETIEFYRRHVIHVAQSDTLDFWVERYNEGKVVVPESLKKVWQITEGHPFRVEMALNWADIFDITSGDMTGDTFDQKIMGMVYEKGEKGDLNIGGLKADQTVFDVIAHMSLITRRFDEDILKHLIAEGQIRHGKKKDITKDILIPMERYFFIKTRVGDYGKQAYQLHDEMVRLVQEYVWIYRDPSGQERKLLLETILRYYDRMIEITKDEILKKNHQIERLYYTFKLDSFCNPIGDAGLHLWFELVDLDDDYINSYLPAEIKEYRNLYNPDIRYEIHSRIAQIEFEAGHITQARKEWDQVYQIGREMQRSDWIATALFALANSEKNVSLALKGFQRAKAFCEKYARGFLPSIYYNIGFTYRRMQNIEKAIRWYEKAQKEFFTNPKDVALGAKIANDLGYAFSLVGKWEECRRNIKEGQRKRKEIQLSLEREVNALESKIKGSKNKAARAGHRDVLRRKKSLLSRARFQLGLSHITLGEIYRYDEDLEASLRNYDTALELFAVTRNYKWQAKALFSRGETLRRIASVRHHDGDETEYEEYLTRAEEDILQSLYLCEKYRIRVERDTANRRMGRVLHDRALHALERKNRKESRVLLERAWERFAEGLRYANETGDDLEILSNQTEQAFLYDDFVRAMGQENVPQKYRDAMKDLKRVLDKQRTKPYRIYQFEVFENEYKLEEAAIAYQEGKYSMALKKYLEGYVGLASDPGYGRTRYKALFHHLTGQIEKLPRVEAAKFCRAFIEAWQTPRGVGKRKVRLERETIFPDMVAWCWIHLEKNTGV